MLVFLFVFGNPRLMAMVMPSRRSRSEFGIPPLQRAPVFRTPGHAAWSIRDDTTTGPDPDESIPLAAKGAHIAGASGAGDRPGSSGWGSASTFSST